MARSNNLLADPYPASRPRLTWVIPFGDGDGSHTSGLLPYNRNVANYFAHGSGGNYDRLIPISGGAGNFKITGETITESVSGATATYLWDDGTFMYLRWISGTFGGGGRTLTGGTSGATRVAGAIGANPIPVSSPWSLDNVLATSRNKRALLLWVWGQYPTSTINCPGHYPLDFITPSLQGAYLNVTPINQVQSETAWGSTVYTAALKAALDTHGRLGALWTLDAYCGPLAASVATDTATLDTYSEFAVYIGLSSLAIDVQSVISHTNTAPPPLMGVNCLAWFDADHLTYDNALALTTTDSTAIRRWSSLVGSNRADQTTVGSQPLLKTGLTNGGKTFSAIQFDGIDDWAILNSATALTTAFTVIAVVKVDTQEGSLLSSDSAVELWRFNDIGAASMSCYNQNSTPDGYMRTNPGTGPAANTWAVVRMDYAADAGRFFVNGTEVSGYVVGATGANLHDGLTFNHIGARADGGKSTFLKGYVASLAIMDAKANANQVALMEAYMAAQKGITLTGGSPTLPQIAFVDRLNTTNGIKTYRENFNDRISASLTPWDSNSAGIYGIYSELAAAIADAAHIYTKTSIGTGQRARVLISNNGPSVATRIANMVTAVLSGYDVDLDPGGFTAADIATADDAFDIATAIVGGVSNSARWAMYEDWEMNDD